MCFDGEKPKTKSPIRSCCSESLAEWFSFPVFTKSKVLIKMPAQASFTFNCPKRAMKGPASLSISELTNYADGWKFRMEKDKKTCTTGRLRIQSKLILPISKQASSLSLLSCCISSQQQFYQFLFGVHSAVQRSWQIICGIPLKQQVPSFFLCIPSNILT